MKKYDIVAVTGEYQTSDGQTKKRYQNVGAVFDKGNGPFIIMERWFNPAGLPNPDNRESVVLSLFEPRDRQQSAHNKAKADGYQPQDDLEDEIPF